MVDILETLRSSIGDRYVVEEEIGRGGMSVVYRAHDRKHKRGVAIKVLKPELSAAVSAERFHREIEVVAGLTHPHILPLHDSGEADGLLYFVMPFVEGESLRERLERLERLPVQDAIRITREIADALSFAHRRGIVHRDIKPGNILLAEDHALLTDFGIAHIADPGVATLTDTSLAVGTPAYFSPEQATGDRNVDARSDLYSLGCVLFEMLTGRPPFSEKGVRALIASHLLDRPPEVRDVVPDSDVSRSLEAVIQTSLRKDPAERFQSASEMSALLGVVAAGGELDYGTTSAGEAMSTATDRRQARRRIVLGAVAVAALVVAGIIVRESIRGPMGPETSPVYVVLPWEGPDLTRLELELTARAATELSWHLSDWESIDVVEAPSVEGPTLQVVRAGVGMPTSSLDAGFELLRDLPATHLIYVYVHSRGDSVELAADIYQQAVRRRSELNLRADGLADRIDLVTADIAIQILNLNGEPAQIEDLNQRSPNHLAHQEFDKGREALLNWSLAQAEQHFRAAIALDPEFALAHSYLATTLYWRSVRDPKRLHDLSSEIEHHLIRADNFGDDGRLRPGERQDLDAFRAFWSGDYETARTRYDSILADTPTDLEALVLAGSVELEDPWLLGSDSDGSLYPRTDLDRARALFDSAVALSSDVPLAWGRLFEIDRQTASSAYEGWRAAFQLPGGPLLPPYAKRDPSEQLGFSAYVEGDSIRWKRDHLTAEERSRTLAAIGERLERTKGNLEWWESVERYQARPLEELGDWLLWERNLRGCAVDPTVADSLLRSARAHTERALEIRGDTTPEDRIRLANLWLASGDTSTAAAQVDRALSDLGSLQSDDGAAPPGSAANVYMAVGRGQPAAEIVRANMRDETWAVPDPAGGARIDTGVGASGMVFALRALGLTADDPAGIERGFAQLDRLWSRPAYDARQQAVLRARVTEVVAPALVQLPERWDSWFESWEEYELELPALWKGILAVGSDSVEARRHLLAALAELEARPLEETWAIDFYMPIVLARRLGDSGIADELSMRAASCPLLINELDFGWGMKWNPIVADDS